MLVGPTMLRKDVVRRGTLHAENESDVPANTTSASSYRCWTDAHESSPPHPPVACFAVSLLARLFRHGRLDLRMAWIREASEKQLPGRLVIECGV